MLQVTIDIVARGKKRSTIGVLSIINDNTGTNEVGNYDWNYTDVDDIGCEMAQMSSYKGKVKRFKRKRGALKLVEKILPAVRREMMGG